MKYVHPHPNDTEVMESILPRTGDYSAWTEIELRSEVARRRLQTGFSGVFSDDDARKSRLVEILTGNDRYSRELKDLAARHLNGTETKP